MKIATRTAGLTAIAAMVGSTLFYLLGDTSVKLAAESVPVFQIIAVRGVITLALVGLAAAVAGVLHHWPAMFSPRILARGGFDALTTLMFLNALANMRIADATAVINAVPIAATLMAVFILRERVGVFRWTAIVIGFVGVLLVLRPEAGAFNAYGLLAVGATVSIAAREIVTRGIPAEVPSLIVTLWSALAVAIAGAMASLVTGEWVSLAGREFGLISMAATFLFGAFHYSVVSLRLGEVSLVGPFRYLIIVWGLIVGYLVWGDVPGLTELSGMALIAVAGLVVFRRELARSRRERS